tara:strand:+ start:27 stop:422 length:396 start_codon:yes stop_codon:yes gene_type:complete
MKSSFGTLARATIERPITSSALGVDVQKVYTITFCIGAGLAGLTGALYIPTMTAVPSLGQAFIISAFVSVVTAGASPFVGLVPAAAFLGGIQTGITFFYHATIGLIGLLIAVIIIIRFLPSGFSGLMKRRK